MEVESYDEVLEAELEQALVSTTPEPLMKLAAMKANSRPELQVKEKAILALTRFWAKQNDLEKIKDIVKSKELFAQFTKPRTIQVVKRVLNEVTKKNWEIAVEACKVALGWAMEEKGNKTFGQVLQATLIRLYVENNQLAEAGELLTPLIKAAKKLDDKALLVDIHLSESSYHLALGNIEKAQGALTACRASGTATWIPHLLTAQIEMVSGTLSTLTKDYDKAYSYFFEAFEGFDAGGDRRAEACLTYMMLAKVVGGKHKEIHGIITSKSALKYDGSQGMKICQELAVCAKEKSVKDLAALQVKYREFIDSDRLMEKTLQSFHDSLLRENVITVLKPYSRVQMTHVAKQIDLPLRQVEKQIVEMILDEEIKGDVDHRNGVVNIYYSQQESTMYKDSVDIITEMSEVTEQLLQKLVKVF